MNKHYLIFNISQPAVVLKNNTVWKETKKQKNKSERIVTQSYLEKKYSNASPRDRVYMRDLKLKRASVIHFEGTSLVLEKTVGDTSCFKFRLL